MKNTLPVMLIALACGLSPRAAQAARGFDLVSPDGDTRVHIEAGEKLMWSVEREGDPVIEPSAISMTLGGGIVLGDNAVILSAHADARDTSFAAIHYIKAVVRDRCNQLTLLCKGEYAIIFRAYNDAVAYRFVTTKPGAIVVEKEEANFTFAGDDTACIPYMWDYRGNAIFNSSFEALYRVTPISGFLKDSLAFLPVLVRAGGNRSVVIMEADLEDYPGMYLTVNPTRRGFMGVFAPYPLETMQGGYHDMNIIPTVRAKEIARTRGTRSFPWRAIAISNSDKDLLNNDLVQELASPPRIADCSWIHTGQVSWDWWNDWNFSHVDFRAGMNTRTYHAYIDFAAANHIPYCIMDAGWSDELDLLHVVPAIDLRDIIGYGRSKGVGIILWASWAAITRQMDTVFPLYAGIGVKGFKIDFIDRDDQIAVASTYAIAKKAAECRLLVDYHGIFKPTGLQRTYPNVVGYEGVKGLENVKWAVEDAPRYAVSIPYIRMLAGPMDYTPGAMRNAIRANFRPLFSQPMSQGTRCQQLAMYIVFYAPLQMLSDNPTIYTKEQECTDFITSIPTTFDETVPLDGAVGAYTAVARRKGNTWYVGAMSNWDPRDLTLSCSFLREGRYQAMVFRDGMNADRDATDYAKESIALSAGDSLRIHLAPGGGWAARIVTIQ